MIKINYRKELTTENDEKVRVITCDNDSHIYITLLDNDEDCVMVALTRKEVQRVKRYLEDAMIISSMNKDEEN